MARLSRRIRQCMHGMNEGGGEGGKRTAAALQKILLGAQHARLEAPDLAVAVHVLHSDDLALVRPLVAAERAPDLHWGGRPPSVPVQQR